MGRDILELGAYFLLGIAIYQLYRELLIFAHMQFLDKEIEWLLH